MLTKNEYQIVKKDWKSPHARQVILSLAIQATIALECGPESFDQKVMYDIFEKARAIIKVIKDEILRPLDSLPAAIKTSHL